MLNIVINVPIIKELLVSVLIISILLFFQIFIHTLHGFSVKFKDNIN